VALTLPTESDLINNGFRRRSLSDQLIQRMEPNRPVCAMSGVSEPDDLLAPCCCGAVPTADVLLGPVVASSAITVDRVDAPDRSH
jgi:hypothetical protein